MKRECIYLWKALIATIPRNSEETRFIIALSYISLFDHFIKTICITFSFKNMLMFRTLNPSRDEALDYMVKTEKILLSDYCNLNYKVQF